MASMSRPAAVLFCALILTVGPVETAVLAAGCDAEGIEVTTMARTDHQATGNRIATGCGPLALEPIEVGLPGDPVWVIADPAAPGDSWLVVLGDGSVLRVPTGAASIDPKPLALLPPGAPPMATIDEAGALRIVSALDAASTFEDALPSARVVIAEDGSRVALTGPTDRYPHGALGDTIEAASVDIQRPDGRWERTIFGDTEVIEGLSPLLADLDGDGGSEVVVTVSSMDAGARLLAAALDGSRTVLSEPIGQGFRWLHQIGAGPTGPDGELEVIVVRTPHIGGIVEAYQLIEGRLVRVASQPGYSSHQLGSENLDMALLADADGDGRLDVVVPTQEMRALAILTRVSDGFEEVATLPLGGRLATNVGAAVDAEGQLSLAVGMEAGVLRIFQ